MNTTHGHIAIVMGLDLEIKQGCSGKLTCSEEHQQAEEEAQKAPEWENRNSDRVIDIYFEAVMAPQQPRKATKPKTRPAICMNKKCGDRTTDNIRK